MGQALRVMQEAAAAEAEEKEYINIIHGSSKGWITKAEVKEDFRQWHYKYKDLINQDLTKENIYISLNTFYSTYRRLEYLKELNAMFIDLDIYKTEFTKQQIIMQLEEDYFNKAIPEPNLIIDSGRGLYLIWHINKVPSQALPLWNAVQDYFYNQLKGMGADKKALDATRILRVPGSINTKSNSTVKILNQYDYIYDLREIQNNYLPELSGCREKKKGRPKKVVYVHRERSLYYARMKDIVKLCELREFDMTGYRELILFLYRYYLCAYENDTETALEQTLSLNSMFTRPLSENEARRATRSAETVYLSKDKQYKYTNNKLIDLLGITEDEEKEMTTIISNREYKRRNNEYNKAKYYEQLESQGKLTEKEKISQRRAKIKDLLAEGLKRKDICLQLNISIKTYKRDISYLKEHGLI